MNFAHFGQMMNGVDDTIGSDDFQIEPTFVDLDNDGTFESIIGGIDVDNDGQIDLYSIDSDLDHNGTFETTIQGIDLDRDGQIDSWINSADSHLESSTQSISATSYNYLNPTTTAASSIDNSQAESWARWEKHIEDSKSVL